MGDENLKWNDDDFGKSRIPIRNGSPGYTEPPASSSTTEVMFFASLFPGFQSKKVIQPVKASPRVNPKISELQDRITQLEAKAASRTRSTPARESQVRQISEYDDLFRKDPKGPVKAQQTSEGASCCKPVWGGPIKPSSDQNLWVWVQAFYGGTTTAHGINQAFKEENGILRRIFWVACFAGAYYLIFWFCVDAILAFIEALTADQVSTVTHGGLLPMVTVCNISPIRCGCAAFYDPGILESPSLVQKILPYVCSSVLTFQQTSWETLDASGNPTNWTILENAAAFVDLSVTMENIRAFRSTINCDNGANTAASIVKKIKDDTLTYYDLYAYAGYAKRGELITGCRVVDSDPNSPTAGQIVSCMYDTWWGPPTFDADYGACHVFNPCQGFPVGSNCKTDDDCGHESDPTLTGGKCGTGGICTCTRCVAGADCKRAGQLSPGVGNGVRITANVQTDQDPPLASAAAARVVDGVIVVLHTEYDAGDLSSGVVIAPGTQSNLAVTRTSFAEQVYPFTNCTAFVHVDPGVCQSNCLRLLQATTCCAGLAGLPPVVKGQPPAMTVPGPDGAPLAISDPRLQCDVLSASVADCFDQQGQLAASGMACVEGAMGFSSPYYGGIMQRINWYVADDVTSDTQVAAQEKKSLAISRQCVWPDSENNLGEARYGKPCSTNADCASSTGGRRGTCAAATRAYCPSACSTYQFGVDSIVASGLDYPAVQVLAADQLAQATGRYAVSPNTVAGTWKPACPAGETTIGGVPDSCFTTEAAQAYVRENYALVNVDFVSFDETVDEKVEGISIATLMGTAGGNMGLFVGMSMMTWLEWFELLAWAVLAAPFFLCCIPCGPFVRRVDAGGDGWGKEMPPELEDPKIKAVMRNVKEIVERRRNGGKGGPAAGEEEEEEEEEG